MILSVITFLSGLMSSLLFIILFNKINFTNKSHNNRDVPYSGGTIILSTVIFSFAALYTTSQISYFKMIFYILSIFCIYFFGFIDDLFGHTDIIFTYRNIRRSFKKEYVLELLKTSCIILIVLYIYYTFNDNDWLLKSIITLQFIMIYGLIDKRPGRCLKVHYLLLLLLSLTVLKWTKELLNVLLITASTYYFFDAFSYSMLGKSGSSILGLTAGMIFSEALGTNTFAYIFSIIFLFFLYFIVSRKIFVQSLIKIKFLNYFDKFLAEGACDNLSYHSEKSEGAVKE